MDKPRFTHDCATCVYLGRFGDYDLYHHATGIETVVARYGSDGPDYTSGLYTNIPALVEAEVRALRMGEVPPNK